MFGLFDTRLFATLVFSVIGFAVFLAGSAYAQSAPAAPQPGPPRWDRICEVVNEREICRMEQQIFAQQQIDGQLRTVGRLALATLRRVNTPEGQPLILDLWLPLGTNLVTGARIKVDDGEEIPLTFQQCHRNGCLVRYVVDDAFLNSLKLGNEMRFGFLPFGSDKTIVGALPLQGFTATFNQLN